MNGPALKSKLDAEGVSPWMPVALMAALVAAVALAYSNTLSSPFVFDDLPLIVENLEVKAGGLADAFARTLKTLYLQRLVPMFTLACNHALGGFDTCGYHLFNIAIHALNGVLLLLVARRAFERLLPERDAILAAFCAAALWALNPVQLYSVTYIIQRMNSLATMFCLGAFLLYLEGRRADAASRRPLAFFTLSGASWLLALLCKQNAAPLPAMVIAYELLIQRQGKIDMGRLWKAGLALALILAAALAVAGISLGWDFSNVLEGYGKRDFTLWERLLSEPRAVMLYLARLALPLPGLLRFDMLDYPPSKSLLEPASTLPSILAVAALLAYAAWMARRSPFVSFCILWYFVMLSVESSVFALELSFLYRAYMPSTMLAALLSFCAFKAFPAKRAMAGLLALAAFWGLLTFAANMDWRTEESLWRSELEKAPCNVRVLESLGCAMLAAGRPEEAIPLFDRAARINPGVWRAHYNKGLILMDRGDFAAAEASLGQALKLYPSQPDILSAMGSLMARTGRPDEAKRLFLKSKRRKNESQAGADYNLGVLEASKGNYKMALALFKMELDANPADWKSLKSVAAIHAAEGRADEAVEFYLKAASVNPESYEVQTGLGLALVNKGRIDEAEAAFRKSLALKPDDPLAHKGLGTCFAMRKDLKAAEDSYRKSISLDPNSAEARNNLGSILAMRGAYMEAEAEFKESLRLQPGNPDALRNLEKVRRRLDSGK